MSKLSKIELSIIFSLPIYLIFFVVSQYFIAPYQQTYIKSISESKTEKELFIYLNKMADIDKKKDTVKNMLKIFKKHHNKL